MTADPLTAQFDGQMAFGAGIGGTGQVAEAVARQAAGPRATMAMIVMFLSSGAAASVTGQVIELA